jgi:hemerythrin superfamily protein
VTDVWTGGRSMLDLLTEDHHRLGQLCRRLPVSADRRLEDVLVATVSRHLAAEEQYLHPTVRKVLPEGEPLAEREVAADAALLEALRRLHDMPREDSDYAAVVGEVTARVLGHTERTGHDMFPRLRERCSEVELVRLGNRVQIAQEAAPTRPHPGTPRTPPLNKIVDPAVGVVDKVRDVLSRRTTYPEDL